MRSPGMRSRRRLAVLAVSALILGAAMAGTGQAQAFAPAKAVSYKYQDYLRPEVMKNAATNDGVQGVGGDQCATTTSGRTGHWFCVTSDNGKVGEVHPNTTNHCIGGSCWTSYSDFESSYSGTGSFGIGSKTLGSVDLYFDVQLNGSQNVDYPVRLIPSTSITSLVISGDRLYYSSTYPGGNHVDGGSQFKTYNKGSVSTNGNGGWASPGYKGYENTVAHGSTVHEWTWSKSGYSGSWYAYDKSVKFDKSTSGGTTLYRNGSASYLGSTPTSGGYNP